MNQQYDKQHATTVIATAAIEPNRFVGYGGAHASSAEGLSDAQGVSETFASPGDAVSCITAYSALVEVAETIAFGDFVTVGNDGTGRAIVGTAADHCGRALGDAPQPGQLVEVQVLEHVHAAVTP
jgi:hypothetical protein